MVHVWIVEGRTRRQAARSSSETRSPRPLWPTTVISLSKQKAQVVRNTDKLATERSYGLLWEHHGSDIGVVRDSRLL